MSTKVLPDDFREQITEHNPEALTCDGLDEAIIGMGNRCGQPALVVYDVRKIIQILMKRDKMTGEEASEFFSYNIEGAWVGPNTPIFLHRFEEDIESWY